ncbi:hypothetical protein J6590_050105 [Homalodisca vitripennis]|nr:hypothetical protein J6590_050105 [Homalodisca vitripennis]
MPFLPRLANKVILARLLCSYCRRATLCRTLNSRVTSNVPCVQGGRWRAADVEPPGGRATTLDYLPASFRCPGPVGLRGNLLTSSRPQNNTGSGRLCGATLAVQVLHYVCKKQDFPDIYDRPDYSLTIPATPLCGTTDRNNHRRVGSWDLLTRVWRARARCSKGGELASRGFPVSRFLSRSAPVEKVKSRPPLLLYSLNEMFVDPRRSPATCGLSRLLLCSGLLLLRQRFIDISCNARAHTGHDYIVNNKHRAVGEWFTLHSSKSLFIPQSEFAVFRTVDAQNLESVYWAL